MSAKLLALDKEMQSSSSDELQVALCSGLQHSGLAEQSRGTDGSSGTSTSVSSVMSLHQLPLSLQSDCASGSAHPAAQWCGLGLAGLASSGPEASPRTHAGWERRHYAA